MDSKLDVALFRFIFSCYANLKIISEKILPSLSGREFKILNDFVLCKPLLLFCILKGFSEHGKGESLIVYLHNSLFRPVFPPQKHNLLSAPRLKAV